MFKETLGVSDGMLTVVSIAGIVTGIVIFAELLGIVTDTTVPEDTVMLPPVGGMTTVSVTGGPEVMLLDGKGTLADGKGTLVEMAMVVLPEGVTCVDIPD